MKILYVGDKYDYGKPERGPSFSYYNFYDSLIKMNGGGNKIIFFPPDEKIKKNSIDKLNEEFLEIIFEESPDLVFFVEGGGIKRETIKKISGTQKTKTLIWMTDDHWQFHKSSKHIAFDYNWVATTDSQAPAKYHKIGYKNVIHTQWACNHFLYQPQNLPKIYDVTFVGASHGNRKKIVEKVKKADINIQCWGSGWPRGRVFQEEMIKIFSQSKINLNFTKSSGVLWKELGLIFLEKLPTGSYGFCHPKRWIDNVRALPSSIWSHQIKGRSFEIPGCNAFCLTEYADNLKDYYEIGKEIDCFNSIPELIEKIKYYLKNNKEREAIAKAGCQRTLRDHTYEKRLNEIFKVMDLAK